MHPVDPYPSVSLHVQFPHLFLSYPVGHLAILVQTPLARILFGLASFIFVTIGPFPQACVALPTPRMDIFCHEVIALSAESNVSLCPLIGTKAQQILGAQVVPRMLGTVDANFVQRLGPIGPPSKSLKQFQGPVTIVAVLVVELRDTGLAPVPDSGVAPLFTASHDGMPCIPLLRHEKPRRPGLETAVVPSHVFSF